MSRATAEPAVPGSPVLRQLRRLRIAALLLVLGLLIEVATLRSLHPFAFLSFAFLGMTLVAAAVLLYLYAIVSD